MAYPAMDRFIGAGRVMPQGAAEGGGARRKLLPQLKRGRFVPSGQPGGLVAPEGAAFLKEFTLDYL